MKKLYESNQECNVRRNSKNSEARNPSRNSKKILGGVTIPLACLLLGTGCQNTATMTVEESTPYSATMPVEEGTPDSATVTVEESTPYSATVTNGDLTEVIKKIYDTSTEFEALCITEDVSLEGGTYIATGKDESVMDVSKNANVSIAGSILKKSEGSASSADDSSFKGVNAAVRVYDQATLTLEDVTIEADASNATGVFAYDGGEIHISDSVITVTGGGAGGVQVAGGGTLYGNNLIVTSKSKAAIRSDRGGGTMVIDGGTYTSTGSNGCPGIYSTADITVSNATVVSENSRAVIIEGKNSVTLVDCDLTGNDQSTKEGSVKANVLLYQSASGDAKDGTSEFTMTGGSLSNKNGAMFYCTNTSSKIRLEGVTLKHSDDDTLLIVSEGRWGKDGSNGGSCTLTAAKQDLTGRIVVDSISSLDLSLEDSTYEGAINRDGAAGKVSVTLSGSSTWTLTEDSYITSFTGDLSKVNANGHQLYVNGKAAF